MRGQDRRQPRNRNGQGRIADLRPGHSPINRRTLCQLTSDLAKPAPPLHLPTTSAGLLASGSPSPPAAGVRQARAARPPGPRSPGRPRERTRQPARYAGRPARRHRRTGPVGRGRARAGTIRRSARGRGTWPPAGHRARTASAGAVSVGPGGLHVVWHARFRPGKRVFWPVMRQLPVAVTARDVSGGQFRWLVLPPAG